MSKKKQPSEIDDLFLLVDKNLIKDNYSVFVLDSGRLVFCNPEMRKSSVKNPIRVSATSGNIEIYYSRFNKFDKWFKFWLLCFAWHRFNSDSEIVSDAFATLKYKEYGGDMKRLFPNFIEVVKHAPSDLNRDRLKQLQLQFLKPKNNVEA